MRKFWIFCVLWFGFAWVFFPIKTLQDFVLFLGMIGLVTGSILVTWVLIPMFGRILYSISTLFDRGRMI